ncbi:unnamed protein product [Caenorhabditis sp. 36 PRJEB53466]|nr:unnamed protein product [Caenorhabditis sp. 36 PRJEB53466]
MRIVLLLVVLCTTAICQDTDDSTTTEVLTTTELNCYWLDDAFYYGFLPSYYYDGKCCNSESIAYLNTQYGSEWTSNPSASEKKDYATQLEDNGYCNTSSTSSTVSTTTSMLTTTDLSTSSEKETTIIDLTTTALACGALADTDCCTQSVTSCLDQVSKTWRTVPSTNGYESVLEQCGCFLTTTTTTVQLKCCTAPGSVILFLSRADHMPLLLLLLLFWRSVGYVDCAVDCSWLSETVSVSGVLYEGQCCTQEVVDYIDATRSVFYFNNWRSATIYSQVLNPVFDKFGVNCKKLATSTTKRTTVKSTSRTTPRRTTTKRTTLSTSTSTTTSPTTSFSTLKCGWLSQTDDQVYSNGNGFSVTYSGECCNSKTIDFLDKWNVSWIYAVERVDRANTLLEIEMNGVYVCTLLNGTAAQSDCLWLSEDIPCTSEQSYNGDNDYFGQYCTDMWMLYLDTTPIGSLNEWRQATTDEEKCQVVLMAQREELEEMSANNCSWLHWTRNLTELNITYGGDCCNYERARDHMDGVSSNWRNDTDYEQQTEWIVQLIRMGLCQGCPSGD